MIRSLRIAVLLGALLAVGCISRLPLLSPSPSGALIEPPPFGALRPEPIQAGIFAIGRSEPSVDARPGEPTLFLNGREAAAVRDRIARREEPLLTQAQLLLSAARAARAPDPERAEDVYGGADAERFRSGFQDAADVALRAALAARFAPDLEQGERQDLQRKARDIALAWARWSLVGVTSLEQLCAAGECQRLNAGLALSIGIPEYVAALDALTGSPALDATDRAQIRTWLERVHGLIRQATFLWVSGTRGGGPPTCHRFSNHATSHIAALASIGYALGDARKVEEAVDRGRLPYTWSTLLRDAIYLDGDDVLGCDAGRRLPTHRGEVYDRYRSFDGPRAPNDPAGDPRAWDDRNRGYGYSTVSALNLALVAELALHHGRDLYRARARSGESVDLPARYLSHYKELAGAQRALIVRTGYPGEETYLGQIVKDTDNPLYELLSARVHQPVSITRALRGYDAAGVPRIWFEPLFFGQIYTAGRLDFGFDLDGVAEGWQPVDPGEIEQAQVRDGALRLRSAGERPALVLRDLELDPAQYDTLVLRMRVQAQSLLSGAAEPVDSALAWSHTDPRGDSDLQRITWTSTADGVLREQRIALDADSGWGERGGPVRQLRLEPVNRAGLRVEIEHVRLEHR